VADWAMLGRFVKRCQGGEAHRLLLHRKCRGYLLREDVVSLRRLSRGAF